jgi:hypothetical protein
LILAQYSLILEESECRTKKINQSLSKMIQNTPEGLQFSSVVNSYEKSNIEAPPGVSENWKIAAAFPVRDTGSGPQ